jgi:hypothetical protein
MDAHPWMYAVAAQELQREGKLVANAPPGGGAIPDPRTYVYFEGCGVLGTNALTFAVKVGEQWLSTDRGVTEYRIARDGCFRAAVPLPDHATIAQVGAVRVQAFERSGKPSSGPVRLTDVNKCFALDDRYVPGASVLNWHGDATLRPGGPPLEIAIQ